VQRGVRWLDGLEPVVPGSDTRASESRVLAVRLATMPQRRMPMPDTPASEIMRQRIVRPQPIMGHRRTAQRPTAAIVRQVGRRPAVATRWQIGEPRQVVRRLRPTALDLPPAEATQQQAVEHRRIVAARWRVAVRLQPIAARRLAAVAPRWRAAAQRPVVAPAVAVMPLAAGVAGADKNSFLALAS
jgi:hypothetical protein